MDWRKFWLWFIAANFYFEQNAYFGWNALPHSDAELIADGITMLLGAIAIVCPSLKKD